MSELPSKSSLNHLGTKKVIVMNDKLAARVAKNPEAIEHLLNNFQAAALYHRYLRCTSCLNNVTAPRPPL